MKKIIALILASVLVFAIAGCGNTNTPAGDGSASGSAATYASAEEVMTTVWNAFPEDQKFPCWGGNAESMVDGAPAAFDVSNTDELTGSLIVPADIAKDIKDASNLMHGMNLNTFTAAAFQVKDFNDFENAYVDNLKSNQWMCGVPEFYYIVEVGTDYVIVVFGADDLASTFAKTAEEVLEGAKIVQNGPVVN